MNIHRLFHIMSLFLAPFFIVGVFSVVNVLRSIFFSQLSDENRNKIVFQFITCFLALILVAKLWFC